jgi:hypothetical protein
MAARLSDMGLTPVVTHHDVFTCIEAHVPQSISPELWRELLAVLATADCFGLVDNSEYGRSVWAGVNKKTPAAVHAARGHGHQR